MSDSLPTDLTPPIIEAVLDIDCDMPPGVDVAALESPARAALRDLYPKVRTLFLQEHTIEARADTPPSMSVRRGVQALQFLQEDEKQLVQLRGQGFSFNRLAPYSSLDDYLPEMERTWRVFVGLSSPAQVRIVRLRYINRILLPMQEGRVTLSEYVRIGPELPDDTHLTLTGFLNSLAAVEAKTGNRVNIILTSQLPEDKRLPLILDIEAAADGPLEPLDWPAILARIQSLRRLKNVIFGSTLTEECLKLFQA